MAETQALALVDPQPLLMKAIEKGVDVEQLRQLLELAKDVRAIQAKEAYLDAVARFKANLPPLIKRRLAKMSKFSYKFAELGDVADVIDPLLAAEGLSYRWETPKVENDKVFVECIVSHRLGHEKRSGL